MAVQHPSKATDRQRYTTSYRFGVSFFFDLQMGSSGLHICLHAGLDTAEAEVVSIQPTRKWWQQGPFFQVLFYPEGIAPSRFNSGGAILRGRVRRRADDRNAEQSRKEVFHRRWVPVMGMVVKDLDAAANMTRISGKYEPASVMRGPWEGIRSHML